MQKIRSDEDEGFEGGRYARTEEELYNKALALLDKCKVEAAYPSNELPPMALLLAEREAKRH